MSLTVQKANFWKRISAYLFDFILAVMLTAGLALTLSAILGYDRHSEAFAAYSARYEEQLKGEIANEYGVDFDITEETYNTYTEEQKTNFQNARQALSNAVAKALNGDADAMKAYNKVFSLSFVIVSISVLLGILVIQFIVPLFFGNGQTLGKKVFGCAVMRSNCVKLTTPVLFIRSIFGMYAIETMFPLALLLMIYFGVLGVVGTITIGLLLILQIGVMIATKNHSSIHDLLTDTVVVDMASQKIFPTQEEMLAYVQEQHAEEVAKKDYI